jgi:pSer/pThr/pTyr-binding forkhead associated (FHA) protein
MIKCTECGYENMDGLDYCDGCGAKLNAAAGGAATGGASGGAGSPPASAPAESGSHEATPPAGETKAAEPPAESTINEATPPKSEAPTGEIKPEQASTPPGAATQTSAPVEAIAAFKAKFIVVRGGRKGQEFALEDGNNLIGRWDPETGSFPEVDLDADDPEAKISRKHALTRIEGGKITVEDIGSLNGTYVNRGQRLQPGSPAEIKNGDEVIIGKTFLKLVVEPVS